MAPGSSRSAACTGRPGRTATSPLGEPTPVTGRRCRCGADLTGRAGQRTCSTRCRVAAFRARRRAKPGEALPFVCSGTTRAGYPCRLRAEVGTLCREHERCRTSAAGRDRTAVAKRVVIVRAGWAPRGAGQRDGPTVGCHAYLWRGVAPYAPEPRTDTERPPASPGTAARGLLHDRRLCSAGAGATQTPLVHERL